MNTIHDAWSEMMRYLRESNEISDSGYSLWIDSIEPQRIEDGDVVVTVHTNLQKNMIDDVYAPKIKQAIAKVMGVPLGLRVISDEVVTVPSAAEPEIVKEKSVLDYSFDNFVVGLSNRFAYAASQAVAMKPAVIYNPLFIYGSSGLGKTHLLYAIGNEIKKKDPSVNVIYTKGETVTNELIEAIHDGTTADFRMKYRNADVFLVDDIQFIAGKIQTQEEFFHTFEALYQANKQIVLTSDRPPREIRTLEERLRTRFEWGLMADISAPDFETRIAIIRRKAELLDFEIPDDVAQYIANRIKSNIRQLEGAVKKLKAYKLMIGASPSIALAQNAIKDILNDNQPVAITVERIIDEVSRTFGVSSADIRSNRRTAAISNARQVAIYIVREVTQMSMAAIGQEFGGRDHSTIVYANSQVEKQMASDRKYKETIEDIIKNIRN